MLSGQAQKEFFVNQALSILDSVQTGTVIASQPAPPSDVAEGACYRVTAPAVAAWEGCEDHLAVRIGGDWHFIPPREGMRLFDAEADHSLFFRESWQSADAALTPSNGTVIDIEARAAINQLIDALRTMGVFANPSP
jgi:Protein of unknown function (DUF2793)